MLREQAPDFGHAAAATRSAAAIAAALDGFEDLFSDDLDSAVIATDANKPAAKCQSNSCLTNNGSCDTHATCTSTGPGTNSCASNSGYSGDGITCTAACIPVLDPPTLNGGYVTLKRTRTTTGAVSLVNITQPSVPSAQTIDDQRLTNEFNASSFNDSALSPGCDPDPKSLRSRAADNGCGGRVEHVLSGRTCRFRDTNELLDFMRQENEPRQLCVRCLPLQHSGGVPRFGWRWSQGPLRILPSRLFS